ncbi:hypothetical protein [Nocardioides sp. B-3]|uniref:hypothetical protein n=1 Tax=Nocardioides sp. B-3 TaxID=2895565 RepID=UPI002153409D|nr:hypothetical protein [Nocardioides sp. B-3]UUZ61925.1 hypothetical protein LP418_02170 [Nocardioides sp. B-3]
MHPTAEGHHAMAETVLETLAADPRERFVVSPEESEEYSVKVERRLQSLSAFIQWPGSDVVLSPVSPSGTVYSRGSTAPGVVQAHGPTWDKLVVPNPEQGAWTVRMYGADVDPGGEEVLLSVDQQQVANQRPVPAFDLTYDGTTLALDATSSSDADGQITTYRWFVDNGETETVREGRRGEHRGARGPANGRVSAGDRRQGRLGVPDEAVRRDRRHARGGGGERQPDVHWDDPGGGAVLRGLRRLRPERSDAALRAWQRRPDGDRRESPGRRRGRHARPGGPCTDPRDGDPARRHHPVHDRLNPGTGSRSSAATASDRCRQNDPVGGRRARGAIRRQRDGAEPGFAVGHGLLPTTAPNPASCRRTVRRGTGRSSPSRTRGTRTRMDGADVDPDGEEALSPGGHERLANQRPVPAFDLTYDGTTLALDATSSSDADGQITTYRWFVDNGETETVREGRRASIEVPAGRPMAVSLQVTDDRGDSEFLTKRFAAIDVMPGAEVASVNPTSTGMTPVAVLSFEGFDASALNVATLRFGHGNVAPMATGVNRRDVDGDGTLDPVVRVPTHAMGIRPGDTTLCMTGSTRGREVVPRLRRHPTGGRRMIRSVVVALVGLFAGWATVPSVFGLLFTTSDGFGFNPTPLEVFGWVLLALLWPVLTVGVGLWLDRVWTGLAAYGVGVALAVVVGASSREAQSRHGSRLPRSDIPQAEPCLA